MSSLAAFFTVCAVLAAGLPVCLWQIHRAWKAEQAANQPAPDPRWGTNTAEQDLCELLWDLDPYEAATTDHTTEGDQS